MNLLLGPALGLIFCSANLLSRGITIFHQRFSANLYSFFGSNLFIFNETSFSKVLLAFFLLLRLIAGDIRGVTSLVIAVVTLDNIIILNLLHHLNFVNTLLAISSRISSSNISKARSLLLLSLLSLTLLTSSKRLLMILVMMIFLSNLGIEGEGVDQ